VAALPTFRTCLSGLQGPCSWRRTRNTETGCLSASEQLLFDSRVAGGFWVPDAMVCKWLKQLGRWLANFVNGSAANPRATVSVWHYKPLIAHATAEATRASALA
jgi:hypothetical protein